MCINLDGKEMEKENISLIIPTTFDKHQFHL